MNKIKFNVAERENYTIVCFDIDIDGVISPESLASLKPPKVDATKGLVLSGRGPIWLYCYLTHYYHITKFIATHDPRVGGAIIIESHTPDYKVGDIIKTEV